MTLTPELQAIGITLPPTQDELPYSDGEPMESERHFAQMRLLVESLQSWLDAREDGYIGGNMFVYYSLAQVKNQDFRGPDFFAALGVPKKERKSWVCWEEGKTPDVVIELLSESTKARRSKFIRTACMCRSTSGMTHLTPKTGLDSNSKQAAINRSPPMLRAS
jgi:Uma2 family endonuclease